MIVQLYNEGLGAFYANGGTNLPHTWGGEEISHSQGAVVVYPTRQPVNLQGFTRGRISLNVTLLAEAGAVLLDYSDDDGESWKSTGITVTVDREGMVVGDWMELNPDARGEVILRFNLSGEGVGEVRLLKGSVEFD